MEIDYLEEFSRGLSNLLQEYKVEFAGGRFPWRGHVIFTGICIPHPEGSYYCTSKFE